MLESTETEIKKFKTNIKIFNIRGRHFALKMSIICNASNRLHNLIVYIPNAILTKIQHPNQISKNVYRVHKLVKLAIENRLAIPCFPC